MPHFAKLDENNVVVNVTVGRQEDDGKELELSERTGDRYVQTSYNTFAGVHYTQTEDGPVPSEDQSKAFRKNFASIGYSYDEERDAFIPPKTFDSWVLDEETCHWKAPVPVPDLINIYEWSEETLSWVMTYKAE